MIVTLPVGDYYLLVTLIQGPYLNNIFVIGRILNTCAYCTTSLLIVIYSPFVVGIPDSIF